ncbi:coiled-coil domain-containing protein [Desulfobacter latus]|uniref:Uncharacterized protein n=1 Tax=Desulfobacter latus TaxID=2292 RepID=A0A850T952_9BACT|nr:hypothetical protein [Desulfobacter latus]NWH03886.1 hypothetical protein [Desulfobacter latus]
MNDDIENVATALVENCKNIPQDTAGQMLYILQAFKDLMLQIDVLDFRGMDDAIRQNLYREADQMLGALGFHLDNDDDLNKEMSKLTSLLDKRQAEFNRQKARRDNVRNQLGNYQEDIEQLKIEVDLLEKIDKYKELYHQLRDVYASGISRIEIYKRLEGRITQKKNEFATLQQELEEKMTDMEALFKEEYTHNHDNWTKINKIIHG